VLFTEKDGAWADQKLAELGGFLPGGIAARIANVQPGQDCILGFASTDKNGDPIYYNCLNSNGSRYSIANHTAIHEHFHMVQNSIYPQNGPMPLWVNEGPPTFFGFALGHGRTNRNGSIGEQFYMFSQLFDPDLTGVADPRRFANWAKTATENQVVAVYTAMEGDPENRDAYNHYGLGAIAAQVLVAVYGVDRYINFIRLAQDLEWKQAFLSTYGVTTTDFYKKLSPYIRALANKYL
jgi:hypothetical protein